MAFTVDSSAGVADRSDFLTGATRASLLDRWLYVFTAASFIAIALTGFVPDSFVKTAAIRSGAIPPFPLALHFHAVLMATFFSLLLAQSTLVAIGKRDLHMQLGIAAMMLVPCLIIATLFAVPAVYHSYWNAAQTAASPLREQFQHKLTVLEDIMLLQLQAAIAFPTLIWIALRARAQDPGLHKRLLILASSTLLVAAFDRIHWLPNTMPHSPLGPAGYVILAVTPMFIWDLVRNRTLHPAYAIFAVLYIPLTVAAYGLWDTPWWHATARQIMSF